MSTQTAAAPRPDLRIPRNLIRFLQNPSGMIATLLLLPYLILAVLGPMLAPYPQNELHPVDALSPPSSQFLFGTDELGRDILSRVIAGTPVALYVSGCSVALALLLGTFLGVAAGFLGGKIDLILMRVIDVMFAFPALLLALVVMAVLGPGTLNAILAIAIVYVPRFARNARASTLSVRNLLFVQAAKLAGSKAYKIAYQHVIPNIMPPLISLAALSLSTALIAYASLSFIGLGIRPPDPDWGSMLANSRGFITFAPWLVIFPSIAIIVLVLAFNLLGDAMRDLMDPYSTNKAFAEPK
jgi:peptide/nickel transport system permease protein